MEESMSMLRNIVLTVVACFMVVTAVAGEKKIKRSELPAAVERTVESESQGATIRGFSRESEKGKTYYEAELTVNGHNKDLLMDIAGAIVEVEEEVAIDSLPAAVRDGLQGKAGEGKLQTVESLTKHGKLVAYEAHVLTHGKRSEIQVDAAGKPLQHEQ
jgi:hypothetical protein